MARAAAWVPKGFHERPGATGEPWELGDEDVWAAMPDDERRTKADLMMQYQISQIPPYERAVMKQAGHLEEKDGVFTLTDAWAQNFDELLLASGDLPPEVEADLRRRTTAKTDTTENGNG